MPLTIVRNDITKLTVDAIVNAANSTLLGGGGVDGCIHRAAGPALLAECRTLGGCRTGEAKITKGYDLPAKYVIHTVGPIYKDGKQGEEALLRSCYKKSLRLAAENGCRSVAFPLISAGVYCYPKAEALRIAIDEISSFLLDSDASNYSTDDVKNINDSREKISAFADDDDGQDGGSMDVRIVIFDKKSYQISEKLYNDVKAYIDDKYVETSEFSSPFAEQERRNHSNFSKIISHKILMASEPSECMKSPESPESLESLENTVALTSEIAKNKSKKSQKKKDLESLLKAVDESFSEMLLRKITEKGMTDVECYKKANIDRKLFSKIRSDKAYKTSKTTAIAFAIALELDIRETEELLKKAGFALSPASKFDIIIEYFIKNKNYNVFEINEVLFAFDQSLLGA